MSYKYFKTFEELLEFICDYYNKTDTTKADIKDYDGNKLVVEWYDVNYNSGIDVWCIREIFGKFLLFNRTYYGLNDISSYPN